MTGKRLDWERRIDDIEDVDGHKIAVDALKEALDEIEGRVNEAKELIEGAKAGSFSNIDEAYRILEKLSKDLY